MSRILRGNLMKGQELDREQLLVCTETKYCLLKSLSKESAPVAGGEGFVKKDQEKSRQYTPFVAY